MTFHLCFLIYVLISLSLIVSEVEISSVLIGHLCVCVCVCAHVHCLFISLVHFPLDFSFFINSYEFFIY